MAMVDAESEAVIASSFEEPPVEGAEGTVSKVLRVVVWLALAFVALGLPLMLEQFHARRWSFAVIIAIAVLSLNVLIGYTGQISLGHQGFLGVGAFVSAYAVTSQGQTFWVGLVAGAASGAIASAVMGGVALRVKGLYLALVTLAYGRVAQESVFNLGIFGSGAGIEAPRPAGFESERTYYLLCLAALGLVLFLDWRFTKSKAGRAVNALRENEQVASSLAINVRTYKVMAFTLAGAFVGLAGALFAHRETRVVGNDFSFILALELVIITVVGGLRSRPGVVLWAIAFTLLPQYLSDQFGNDAPFLSNAIGAVLLIVILARFPGGIGQLISPITRWLRGQRFTRQLTGGSFVKEGVSGRP